MTSSESKSVVLYDGVCGLCNGLVQFLLKRDTQDRLRYASLQSDFSSVVLKRHGADPKDLDTVYVVVNRDEPSEKLLARSDAILYLAGQLGGIWQIATIGRVIPKALRDAMYKLVATNRYRVFGKYETCMLPEPGEREKFIDV
ncbi:MAG TPA: DCC1-like thiol-disulfide oxidoreductase family protein [Pyrinomonadaceae bacterium]|nr:DCC1-like thiol-disulfide oxidoreductase family protein [Pyrinomonadaceae bacterium]